MQRILESAYALPDLYPALTKELREIAGLSFEDDRFDNMPTSFNQFPLFKEHVNELLEVAGFGLEQPPRKGTKAYRKWDTSIGFNAFDLQRHTASVDGHTDDVTLGRYFGLFVIDAKPQAASRRSRYFDNRSEFRYFNQSGSKERKRLDEGDLVIFNPRRSHELIYFGDLTTLALFDVKKLKTS